MVFLFLEMRSRDWRLQPLFNFSHRIFPAKTLLCRAASSYPSSRFFIKIRKLASKYEGGDFSLKLCIEKLVTCLSRLHGCFKRIFFSKRVIIKISPIDFPLINPSNSLNITVLRPLFISAFATIVARWNIPFDEN